MFIKRAVLFIVLGLCCSQASAEITLKKSLFTGWKYSTNGIDYKKVGFSGRDLNFVMERSPLAQSHMKKYRSAKLWATVTGIPGGVLIGWPIGFYMGSGGEWKDSHTTMMAIGAPLAALSTLLEIVASDNLKKAVKVYNSGDDWSFGLSLSLASPEFVDRGTWLIGMRFGF